MNSCNPLRTAALVFGVAFGTLSAVNAIAAEAGSKSKGPEVAASEPQGLLRMAFRDSERGTAVTPDFLSVDGKTYFPLYREGGYADIKLESGDHTLVIKARGYDDMTAKETALIDDPPLNVILLDPKERAPQMKAENLSRFMKPDHGLVTGFVVDEEFSKALADVDVTLVESGEKAKTDETGFFVFAVPLPEARQLPEDLGGGKYDRKTIVLVKEGFGKKTLKNLLIQPQEPKFLQVRLKSGDEADEIDEEEHRGGLQKVLLGNEHVIEGHEHSASETSSTLNHDSETTTSN